MNSNIQSWYSIVSSWDSKLRKQLINTIKKLNSVFGDSYDFNYLVLVIDYILKPNKTNDEDEEDIEEIQQYILLIRTKSNIKEILTSVCEEYGVNLTLINKLPLDTINLDIRVKFLESKIRELVKKEHDVALDNKEHWIQIESTYGAIIGQLLTLPRIMHLIMHTRRKSSNIELVKDIENTLLMFDTLDELLDKLKRLSS
jgi:hypothetical protein